MSSKSSIKLGNLLYKHAFPVYNLLYPRYKARSDKSELKYISSVIQEGDCVLDIGGNIGFYCNIFSRLVGSTGQVHSFEPDITNFKYLTKNTFGKKNIMIYNTAVSSNSEGVKLYISKTLNVDHRTYPHSDSESSYTIPSITIDSFIKDIPVDFIKMDIQGFEYYALQGMKETLTQQGPKILMEFWPHGLKSSGTSPIQIVSFLDDCGYNISILETNGIKPFTSDPEATLNWSADKYINIVAEKR